jgi:transposase
MARWRRDLAKERHWRRHVARWQSSGLSIRAYCRNEALSEPSFHAWRRVLHQRQEERPAAPAGGAAQRRPPTATAFVPVRLVETANAGSALEIVVRGGRVVRVAAGFSANTLREVLAVLEEPPC